MKVGMYYSNFDVRVEHMNKPKINAHEILVKSHLCGICGSDVLEWYRSKKAPIVLGHEMVGKIEQVGESVKQYKVGQRVFVSHHVPCNTCYYCLRGYHTACKTLHATNYDPGGFSEFVRIPQINVDRGVFVLPDSVTDEQGVFIEPLACVIRAQKLIQIKPGETILIIGSGISGLLHLLVAKTFGAGKIIAIDINSDRLKFAKQFGADYVYDARDDIGTNLKVINEGRLADKILVCTGALSAFESSLNYVERGGTILSFATTEPGQDLALPLNTFWRNEIKIMPSYGNAPVDALEAIELINSERIPVEKLISHKIPLDDIQEGFSMTIKGLDSSGNPSLKVIVEIGDA